MTQAHIDGTCGGDSAGCARCIEIAALNLNYSDPRRQALASRRNRPHGMTSVIVPDPEEPTRLHLAGRHVWEGHDDRD